MYRKMLVPLDASELSVAAFPYAKEVAARLDLDVILLHVCTQEERGSVSRLQADIDRKAEIVRRQVEEVRNKIRTEPEGKSAEVKGEVALGSPANEILRCAGENDVDMILMATRGRSGVKRLVMGSVAKEVLRKSNVPVCLIRPGAPEEAIYDQWPGRMILVPLDGSELAEAVLPHVEALAGQQGTEPVEVVLVRVCNRPTVPVYPEGAHPASMMEYVEVESARRKQVAQKYLAEIEVWLQNAGLVVRSEVLEGRPGEQMLDYANAHPCSLIVMSTHARSGLRRLALGSVAAKLLQEGPSPMVLVKTDRPLGNKR